MRFNGQRAMADVVHQVNLGARIPGSQAHAEAVQWILEELEKAGWSTEVQDSVPLGHQTRNIIGKLGQGKPITILGAHYDSRLLADQDPVYANRKQPVPGANDGASGVAVLLELARVLPSRISQSHSEVSSISGQIWLVFFDMEDNGKIAGWDWCLGSQEFVRGLSERPNRAVIIDMVGDANLNIYMEKNSDPVLNRQIWSTAQRLGFSSTFLSRYKYAILDDHLAFLRVGIPAVDIIDMDYPFWHTTSDTADKVSASSLEIVGTTLLAWLVQE
jgi:Zn-dependent M28 family amino/carboxypeptidase